MGVERTGAVRIPAWFEWIMLGGLPLGGVLSAALGAFARLWVGPLYADLDLEAPWFTALVLSTGWNLGCVLVPLLTLALCLLLIRSAPIRMAVAFVVFHLWLAAFVATAIGLFAAFLSA